MKEIVFVIVLCLGFVEYSRAATSALSITEATRFCEREVPRYCVETTCPIFCNSLRTKRQRDLCNSGCANSRCKLSPGVAGDSSNNLALDAQNREQLIACIAEKRDPNANKTGRRTTPWKDLRTASFTRATRP